MVETLLLARGVLFLAGLLLLGVAVWSNWNRNTPAMRSFVLFVAVLGTLAVADAVAAGALTSLSLVWVTTFLAIPTVFTWFVVEYYGLPHLVSTWRRIAFLAPAVVGVLGGAALILSPSAAGSMTGGGPVAPTFPSPMGLAALAEQAGLYYAGGVMLAGVALLGRTVSNYEYLDRRLAVTLSFVAIWPWLAYFLTPGIASSVSLSSILGLNAAGYALSSAAVVFAVTRGGLFDAAPAAGTLGDETVLAELDDAVLVVDHDQRVVTLNEAAVETFGDDRATAVAEPLSTCVGTDLETLRDSETVELTVPEGTRHFEASVSPIRDRFDRQPGHAIVIADVTQERIRSQRLTVLNRVLRHNLRNRMSSIMGRAEIIADSDNPHADSADAILTSADDLVSLSERARQAEEMLELRPETKTELALADLVERVLEDYRTEYPEATLSGDIDDSLTLSVDSRILRYVLDNLVENALVHNDAPTRIVTVSARLTEGNVRLAVSDNGPGVPDHERAVIDAEDENPLEHGSGLGLWAVKWGVLQFGGELEITDNKPHGAVVTIDLPAEVQAASESTVQQPVEAD